MSGEREPREDAPLEPGGERSTIARPRVGSPTVTRTRFELAVVEGPSTGAKLVVDPTTGPRIFGGTSASCHLVVVDALVSRRHVAFELEPSHLRLQDLGSTNGTKVNGVDVVEARLFGGERIAIGETRIDIRRLEDAEPPPLPPARGFGRLIGESAEMRRLYPLMARLAMNDLPIIIEGETGTGKELLAEAIHEASPRAGGPYVVFDCTVGPSSLLESALFGHERGAFTGAVTAKAGVFEQAHGGTLLIDEIGDLDVALQAKLLRALQRREVQRLGSNRWIAVDVRIMAATRRDLEKEIQAERFRDDLYYRLAVARLELPALRRRTGDVAVLANHFWSRLGGTGQPPATFLERLDTYSWPGNVRELHNAVAHEVALGDLGHAEGLWRPARGSMAPSPEPGATAGGAERSDPSTPSTKAATATSADTLDAIVAERLPYPRARDKALATFDEKYITDVLARHGGNVTKAAAASGIARRYFYVVKSRGAK